MAMKTVAVVMGGNSHEAEISLLSGARVCEALVAAGYTVRACRLTRDAVDEIPTDVDVVFIALHGGYGEGGDLQADLNGLGLPYTGPGAQTSRIAMDKLLTRNLLVGAGIPMAASTSIVDDAIPQVSPLALPVVVKPPRDGSSVGLSLVQSPEGWLDAAVLACRADPKGEAMVEAYIPGRELTVSVVRGRALPVVEIVAPGGWYDYEAKYASEQTRYTFPKEDEVMAHLQRLAERVFEVLGCRGVCRVDFRLTPENEPYVLEVNTVPGCTSHSLLPMAAERAGVAFEALCAQLVECAQCDESN